MHRRNVQVYKAKGVGYGLGWVIFNEQGYIMHDGFSAGFNARMIFNPQQNLGFVILTNTQSSITALAAISQKIIELANNDTDSTEDVLLNEIKKYNEEKISNFVKNQFKLDDTHLSSLLGKFYNKEIGEIEITKLDDQFFLYASSLANGYRTPLIGMKSDEGAEQILTDMPPIDSLQIKKSKIDNGIEIIYQKETYECSRISESHEDF